ncbi:MAG: ABC transporter substrate-binding protein [Gemmatimonadota bacterium]|nr:MAG: ABC transporter substrate-binding protein [Gemmatimonadota bacterium]
MSSRRSARFYLAAVAVVGVMVSASGCGGGGERGEVVRFGFAAPVEQYIGSETLRGAQLALERVNADNGIRGRTLELVAVTDSANPERAVRVAESFYTDESVVAVIGHVNSGATLAAVTIYNRGLAAVSPTATSPEISGAGPWIFRVCSSDAANSAGLARFALRELGSRAAILYANEPYGRGLREGFALAYAAGGGTLLEEYPYIEGRTTDFEPYLLGIQGARPDLIFVAGLDISAGPIIRQARALGITVPFIGGDGILGLAGLDPVYDGTYVGLLYHPDAPGATGQQFVEAYRRAHGGQPDHFAALGYDAVLLVAEAVREVGFDRARIRDYLEEVGTSRDAFRGVSGLVAFDENGDPLEKSFAVGRIAGEAIELISIEGGS